MKITPDTLIPLSALGTVMLVLSIAVTDHNLVKANSAAIEKLEQAKEDHANFERRLDKKVMLILFKLGIKYEDN